MVFCKTGIGILHDKSGNLIVTDAIVKRKSQPVFSLVRFKDNGNDLFTKKDKHVNTYIILDTFLPARRYGSASNRHRNVSVRPSVTRRYCVKTKKASGMISSPSGSPKTLVY